MKASRPSHFRDTSETHARRSHAAKASGKLG
eukprot:CAMPEP_0185445046 /NCGR_PEP_ID=MMETSP1365-20130426/51219_1 /TAXON_ID=38817 /ORGANISM="Gephyrocapsa oceanica, Strain RCC1303" /LENGTH=30 /DNA_ID= /DNA_START= /DNA_END= /DNA_ORIENTATION=